MKRTRWEDLNIKYLLIFNVQCNSERYRICQNIWKDIPFLIHSVCHWNQSMTLKSSLRCLLNVKFLPFSISKSITFNFIDKVTFTYWQTSKIKAFQHDWLIAKMFVNFVPNFSYFGDKKVFADSIPSITYTRFFQNFVAQKIWQRKVFDGVRERVEKIIRNYFSLKIKKYLLGKLVKHLRFYGTFY